MDRYQRVEKPRAESSIAENEIRITSQGRMRNYITYAMNLLQDKGSDDIVFKAMGRAISKTVTIVELIKRRIVGLHQKTSIGSTDVTDTWEPWKNSSFRKKIMLGNYKACFNDHNNPVQKGAGYIISRTHTRCLRFIVGNRFNQLSTFSYQPPLPAEQVKASTVYEYEDGSPRGRGRGRGGRGRGRSRGNGYSEHDDGGWVDRGYDYDRGRGWGRGHGFQGRGRGGYNGPLTHAHQEFDGYHQDVPHRGHGRGGRSNGGDQNAAATNA